MATKRPIYYQESIKSDIVNAVVCFNDDILYELQVQGLTIVPEFKKKS